MNGGVKRKAFKKVILDFGFSPKIQEKSRFASRRCSEKHIFHFISLTSGTGQLKKSHPAFRDLCGFASPRMEAACLFSGAETTVKVGSCSASLLAAVAVAATLGLPGCDSNSYSAAIRYLVRSDPLVITDKLGPADNPGGERNNPDRPGQLPLFTANDLLEFPNPYFKDAAERDDVKLFDQNKMMDPSKLSGENRKILQDALDDLFGTPAEPKLEGIDSATRDKILLPPEEAKQGITAMQMLEKGSKYYRIHCLHCHGVTGNGRGPTSRWVNPHPRDYRRGFFKFQSTDQTEKEQKPSRADLLR